MLRVGPFLIITRHSFYDQMIRWWDEQKLECVALGESVDQIQMRQDYQMSVLELFRRFIFR